MVTNMAEHTTPGYPFPDTRGPISKADAIDVNEARMVWRRSLQDTVVRAMAADYRMGNHDQDNLDAYMEYQSRLLGVDDAARSRKNAETKRKKRRSRD